MEEPSELMQTGLTIEPVWFDTDVVQYRITASNGAFCGTTHVYALHDSPRAWAEQLAGFPQRASDCRRLTCGASSPLQAGGFADLQSVAQRSESGSACRPCASRNSCSRVATSSG
jgi:hypothetical protein